MLYPRRRSKSLPRTLGKGTWHTTQFTSSGLDWRGLSLRTPSFLSASFRLGQQGNGTLIEDNTIARYGNVGIQLQNNDGSSTMNASVFGNNESNPSTLVPNI